MRLPAPAPPPHTLALRVWMGEVKAPPLLGAFHQKGLIFLPTSDESEILTLKQPDVKPESVWRC